MPLKIIVLDLFLVLSIIVLISLAVLTLLSPIFHLSFLLFFLFISAKKAIISLLHGDSTRFFLAVVLISYALYMLYEYKNLLTNEPEYLSFPFNKIFDKISILSENNANKRR